MRITYSNVVLLPIIGISLVAIGLKFKLSSPPGRLVAEEPEVLWQCPAEELGRTLAHAKARFRLTNAGGRVVNILSVESGCGCAKPVPSKTFIGPGRSVSVDVEGSPFPIGDRTVPITIHTDAPETPTIGLKLRMIGSRKPPFLLDASGELAFLDVGRPDLGRAGENRQFVVRMVEYESSGREPSFRVNPSSLVIEKVSTKANPYVTPGTVVRTHVYRVSFSEPPAENRIAGVVSVVDPWFKDHVTDLKIYAEIRSRIKAFPPQVNLAMVDGVASAEVLILTNEPVPVTVDQFRIDTGGPLLVEPIRAKGGVATFRVTATLPAGTGAVVGKVTFRISSIANELAVVTVTSREGER